MKVIDAIETALDLNQGELNLEREVLRDYGNMSAPTVLFVLERLLRAGPSRSGDDDRLRPRLHLRRADARSRVIAQHRRSWRSSRCSASASCGCRTATRGACSRKARAKSAPGHYPLIVAVHALWLAAFGGWRLAARSTASGSALFVLIELARIWVLATLGPRWTTRIIVLPERTARPPRPVSLRQSSQLCRRHRRNRRPAAGLRPVAGGADLQRAERRRSRRPHPRGEPRASAASLPLAPAAASAYIAALSSTSLDA